MKNAIVWATATLGSGLVAAATVGCNPAPYAVYEIKESELPPAAKQLVAPDSKITSIHEAIYAKGNQDYIIDYVSPDGSAKRIAYGDYHQSQPTGVFEKFAVPDITN